MLRSGIVAVGLVLLFHGILVTATRAEDAVNGSKNGTPAAVSSTQDKAAVTKGQSCSQTCSNGSKCSVSCEKGEKASCGCGADDDAYCDCVEK